MDPGKMKVQNWSKIAVDREAWKRIVNQTITRRVVVPREEEGASLFRQFYVILYVIDKCTDLARYFSNFMKHFCGNLVNSHELYLRKFQIPISKPNVLAFSTSASAVCISVCQTSLMPCTLNN